MGKNNKKKKIAGRILLSLIFLGSIFLMPWWATVAIALILVINTNAYELPACGVIMDSLYSLSSETLLETGFIFTLLFLCIFLAGNYIKLQMRTQ